ncbi:hypothetical protein Aperf_G00000014527 [Anoplocephala perfoliata]
MCTKKPVTYLPLEKRSGGQKKRRSATITARNADPPPLNLDAEFWELQQNVTMLRRRLKQCQNNPPVQPQIPRELIPSESLDTEEVFNFSLRKPVAPELMELAPVVPPPEVKPPSPRPEQKDNVPSPKVESFPVEWPTTAGQTTGLDSEAPQESIIAVVADATEVVPVCQEEVEGKEEEDVVSERPTLPSEPAQEKAEEEHQPLDPASQYLLSIYNYWAMRQQELLACQHDLKSRIRSQKAEIARIEMCIEQMISTGKVREQQVRQYLRENEHFLRIPSTPSSGQQHSPSLLGFAEVSTDDSEDDDDDDDDEAEMAATLLQLMRDNARLEALNAAHIENIIAERDSCAHLKVQLRLSTCLPPPPLPSLQMNTFR